jgi:NitT/TauT family transport system substrate-binding protein
MTSITVRAALAAAFSLITLSAQAQVQVQVPEQERVRLGNVRMVHAGALSYTGQIAARCGLRIEETLYARGEDVLRAMAAGELDVGASAAADAIAQRAGGAPIFIVAGVGRGGLRLVARPGQHLRGLRSLKGKKVGVTPGAIGDLLLMAGLQDAGLSAASAKGADVQLIYLPAAQLNAALMSRRIDAMMQAEPQSSQALSAGYGVEVLKPYDTAIGEPVRTMVMTEAFYHRKRALAEQFMRCFVQATKAFIDDRALAERYVRDVLFKGELGSADFHDASANSPFAYDVSNRHIQVTTDTMVRTGVGHLAKAPLAREWVRTDLLDAAKKSVGVK